MLLNSVANKHCPRHFPDDSDGKNLSAMWETRVWSLGWEGLFPKKGMATHCSIPAWRIPWTEETGGLQFMGSQRVRHDRVTNTHRDTYNSKFPLLPIFGRLLSDCTLYLYIFLGMQIEVGGRWAPPHPTIRIKQLEIHSLWTETPRLE